MNYTPLGNGTAAGSNWTLTGLNLPTGQNIYIRARGYYRSGYYNGSESITESVRNAFLVAEKPCTVCHRGMTTVVLPCDGLEYQRHLDHGDTAGACAAKAIGKEERARRRVTAV